MVYQKHWGRGQSVQGCQHQHLIDKRESQIQQMVMVMVHRTVQSNTTGMHGGERRKGVGGEDEGTDMTVEYKGPFWNSSVIFSDVLDLSYTYTNETMHLFRYSLKT